MKQWFLATLRYFASPHVIAIADLLRDNANGWERSKHWLTHDAAGLRIWVANADYGLHVEQINSRVSYENRVRLSYFDRKLIWLFAKRIKWHDPVPDQIIQRVLSVLRAQRTH